MQNYQDLPLSTADKLFVVATVADLPVNAVESELRWVSDVASVYAFNGTSWAVISGGISPAAVTNSTSVNLSVTLGVLSATVNDAYVRGLFSATAPITLSAGGVIAMPAATSSVSGYLTSGDWSTFNSSQPADADLTAIAALTGPGIAVKTSTDPAAATWANRSIVGTTNRLGVSNGDGAGGNPTLNIDTSLLPSPITADATKFLKASAADAASWQALGTSDIPNLDANKITSGTFDIARIPAAALERLVVVADQPARFALTTLIVQNGDSVKQTDTNVMYMVYDDTQLSSAAGYVEYAAGTAAAVAWSGITSKPANLVAIAAMTGPGFVTKTSTDPASVTYAQRTVTGTTNRVGVTNGDGVSGNPTINIDTSQFPQAVAGDAGKSLVASGADSAAWGTPTAISDAGCSGLVSWGGSGNYYSYVGGTFTVLRPGVGRINGTKITWAGGESVTGLAANKGYLIGFTATNTLAATDISTLVSSNKQAEFDLFDSFYQAHVAIYGIWTDGAYPQIVKEEHPYEYSTDISVHDHFKFGQTFTFGGALLSVLSAASRTIQTSGEDMLDDHGLTTRIADQAGSVLDCFSLFQNGSGIAQALARTGFNVTGVTTDPTDGAVYSNNGNQFTVFVSTLTGAAPNKAGLVTTWTSTGTGLPAASGVLTKVSGTGDATINYSSYTIPTSITYTYAPAGVPTPLNRTSATRYGIIAIYASKDDKQTPNTTTPLPKYFQVMSSAAYSSSANAANSIGTGASPNVSQFVMPSEMRAIELVLNGFVIIDGSSRAISTTTTNGFVAGVKTVKASISTSAAGGSVTATTANNVSADTTAFNGALSAADVNVQLALNTLDDAKANRYSTALSWVGGGPWNMTITAAAHGRGVNPIVQVQQSIIGISWLTSVDIGIVDGVGDITIESTTNFTGSVTVL